DEGAHQQRQQGQAAARGGPLRVQRRPQRLGLGDVELLDVAEVRDAPLRLLHPGRDGAPQADEGDGLHAVVARRDRRRRGRGDAGDGAGAGAGSGAAAAAASVPPLSIRISSLPTASILPTSPPSATTRPSTGDGMSTFALSVITLASTWSSATASPGLTCHST